MSMLSFVLSGKDANEWAYFEQQWRGKQQFPWLYAMHECIFQYSWQWWACFTCMSEVRSLSRRWSNTTSTQLEWEKEKVNNFSFWLFNWSPKFKNHLLEFESFTLSLRSFFLSRGSFITYLRIFYLKVAEVKPLTKQWSL